jgi:uroporphyrinogen-III synthase
MVDLTTNLGAKAQAELTSAAVIPWQLVITRPTAQAKPWAAAMGARGFTTLELNLLAITGLQQAEQLQAIKNQVMELDAYSKVIFVSQNAVDQGMSWIERYWPQLPIKLDFYAVGAASARRLADYGVQVEDLAQAAEGAMTSETLLQAASLQQVSGQKILIMRGLGGRGHLADELRARGAQVEYCELYERSLPANAEQELQLLLSTVTPAAAARTIISLHSGESLENLQRLIVALNPSDIALPTILAASPWCYLHLLIPSERVLQQAQAAGWQQCILAQNATDGAMTQALDDYCQLQK